MHERDTAGVPSGPAIYHPMPRYLSPQVHERDTAGVPSGAKPIEELAQLQRKLQARYLVITPSGTLPSYHP